MKITYLAHQVSKDGVCPSNSNLEAIIECAPPHTYMEVHAFLSLVGHYRRFIKGFACIAQPLSEYLAGEGASREVGVGVTYRGCHEGFWSVETGMHDSSHLGVHWLHQTIPVGDWCVPRWIGGSVVTEAGRWAVSSHCLWQQSPDATWEDLLLNQTWVSGIKNWQLLSTLKSTCPTHHLWCGWIIIYSHT